MPRSTNTRFKRSATRLAIRSPQLPSCRDTAMIGIVATSHVPQHSTFPGGHQPFGVVFALLGSGLTTPGRCSLPATLTRGYTVRKSRLPARVGVLRTSFVHPLSLTLPPPLLAQQREQGMMSRPLNRSTLLRDFLAICARPGPCYTRGKK